MMGQDQLNALLLLFAHKNTHLWYDDAIEQLSLILCHNLILCDKNYIVLKYYGQL